MKDNPVASFNEYELRHMAAHLEATGRVEDLHRLLRLQWIPPENALTYEKERETHVRGTSTPSSSSGHKNAWYEAHEQAGIVADYLNDVERAWRLAEEAGRSAHDVISRGESIGLQCRYALIVTSIKSLASHFPPSLLVALVNKNVWTPIQGLTYARQIVEEYDRSKALVGLAPHLSEPLLQEALASARTIAYAATRAEALAGVAPHFSEPLLGTVLQESLTSALSITDDVRRARTLANLVPRIGKLGHGKEALDACGGKVGQVEVLVGLAPHLSEPLLPKALATARSITSEREQAKVLARLVSRMGELDHGKEALDIARSITDRYWQAWALASLIPHLPEPLQDKALQDALAIASSITNNSQRTQVLVELAPHLSESLLQKALATARSIADKNDRAMALGGLAPYLSAPLQGQVQREALTAARSIQYAVARAWALADLVPYLSEPLQGRALQTVRTAARSIGNEEDDFYSDVYYRELELLDLVSCLKKLGHRKEVLDIVCQENSASFQARALAALAPHLSEPLLQKGLAAARSLDTLCGESKDRAEALAALAPHLSEPLQGVVMQEALEAARSIDDLWEWYRAQALVGVVSRLGELGHGEEALIVSFTIGDEEYRAQALAALAPHLSGDLLDKALIAAYAINYEGYRAQALAAFVPQLSGLLQCIVKRGALTSARSIRNAKTRAEALLALAPHLPESLQDTVLQEALDAAHSIDFEFDRSQMLKSLVPQLSKSVLLEALATAFSSTDQNRMETLTCLVSRLGALGYGEEALDTACSIADRGCLPAMLVDLASHLSGPLLQKALVVARSIAETGYRVQVLMSLAPHLSEPLRGTVLQEALAAAPSIANEVTLAEALTSLASRLGELGHGEEALDAARSIPHVATQARALLGLVPCLPESLRGTVLQEVRAVAPSIDKGWGPPDGGWSRGEVLADLASRLGELGLREEALAVARSIPSVAHQTRALVALAPHLPEPLQGTVIQEALTAARSIGSEPTQARALVGLALSMKQLSVIKLYSLWSEILPILASRTRSDMLPDIEALYPIIAVLGGKVALAAIAQAMIEVGEWFP